MEIDTFNLTGMPKVIEEIFNLKTKRDEASASDDIGLLLSTTHNLWIVCKPYIRAKKEEEAQKLTEKLSKMYFEISSTIKSAETDLTARKFLNLNVPHHKRRLLEINGEIEQLLYDCDILGGKNGEPA